MIATIQNVIQVGNDYAVRIPAEGAARYRLRAGDPVKVIIEPAQPPMSKEGRRVVLAAKAMLERYDFALEGLESSATDTGFNRRM